MLHAGTQLTQTNAGSTMLEKSNTERNSHKASAFVGESGGIQPKISCCVRISDMSRFLQKKKSFVPYFITHDKIFDALMSWKKSMQPACHTTRNRELVTMPSTEQSRSNQGRLAHREARVEIL